MQFTLRPYQSLAVDHIKAFLSSAAYGDKRLYSAPTGSGKSVIELALLAAIDGLWLITPKIEIIAGMLQKLDLPISSLTQAQIIDLGFQFRISTPVRLRNAMMRGSEVNVACYLFDEGHHVTADVWSQLQLLQGNPPAVALTATAFRGTPKETKALREVWGEPFEILTYPEAIQLGVIAMPSIRIVPLVDDDLIEIKNGEFEISAVNSATQSRFLECIELLKPYYSSSFDRPTMISLPSTDLCVAYATAASAINLPVEYVTQDTTFDERARIFRDTVDRKCALAQINVVSEGVDLPLRRHIDISPTFSPVIWLQRFGRITRPTDDQPEYICTNRNFLRHCYLLDGCLPADTVAKAQSVFPPSSRDAVRAFGLESLGRLKPSTLPLANGVKGSIYCVSSVQGNTVKEFAAILHPAKSELLWATREITADDNNCRTYGKWRKCQPPENLQGFASVNNLPVSEAQRKWWENKAKFYGLDVNAEVTRKNFAALPILSDLGVRFR